MDRGKRQAISSFFGGKGFYIALLLCVVTAAAAGYYVMFTGNNAQETGQEVDDVADTRPPAAVSPQVVEDEPETETEEPPRQTEPVQVILPEVTEETESIQPEAPVVLMRPLAGETVSVFSGDSLQYNETMGDWRTHNGIDIAAEAGTPVVAAAAGTVLLAAEDDRLGHMVVVAQDDGYEVTYASLGEDLMVAQGDRVECGQELGAVANSSLTESALGAHLHFSVVRDGTAVDPEEYLPD